ncbi:MAG: hypothetical protein LBP98_10500 [Tannerella sp.]|nr:hypothetical protein [Tannerella sp.]
MKRTIYWGMVACAFLTLASCDNELENWNSATYAYDGRYVVAAVCQEKPSKNAIIEKGNEIYLYNTAANIANEIWLEDVSGKFPLKCKLQLNGNPANFSGTATAENVQSKYFIYNAEADAYVEFADANAGDFPAAGAAGQSADGTREYVRITLEEGQIQPASATTVGGNIADGIALKFTLHTDLVKFVSYELPAEEWSDPSQPEYGWQLVPNSNTADPGKDEHWTLTGYRYTGYPEDS